MRDVIRPAPRLARYVYAAVGGAAVIAAFLRGNYLLGHRCGVIYVVITLALLRLFARSRTSDGRASVARVVVLLLMALPIGCAMAFPASLNSDLQTFIDQQETERQARAELAAVFASDPKYRDLTVSSAHRKLVCITIEGALGTRSEQNRLQKRIDSECPALSECVLFWSVAFRDPGESGP